MVTEKQKIYSIIDYLKLEDRNEFKSEYEAGFIKAMSGGALNHSIIGCNINAALSHLIKENNSPCTLFNSDAKVFIEQAESFVYPDSMVVCGEFELSSHDKNSLINPVLVIEVFSKSTEGYDRGDKFHKYCSLTSFKEYILIDQYKPVVDILFRENNSYWKMMTIIGMDQSIYINTLDVHIPMKDIYDRAVI